MACASFKVFGSNGEELTSLMLCRTNGANEKWEIRMFFLRLADGEDPIISMKNGEYIRGLHLSVAFELNPGIKITIKPEGVPMTNLFGHFHPANYIGDQPNQVQSAKKFAKEWVEKFGNPNFVISD